jgi:hypothetical protein
MFYKRQTHPSIQAVHLVGSWDNFGRAYKMDRDIRRDRGQWRGCYSFKDIICDGDAGGVIPKRNGGLKMGQVYYYYVCAMCLAPVPQTPESACF